MTDFINKNLGVVVSAIVGVATIGVSFIQLQISSNSARAQMELELRKFKFQSELDQHKLEAATAKDDRTFAFDFARFLLEKQSDLNTNDRTKIGYLRNVVIATLPTELGTRVTRSMAEGASSDQIRSVWQDGLVRIRLANAPPIPAGTNNAVITADQIITIFPQISTPLQQARLRALLDAAKEGSVTDTPAVMTLLAAVFQGTAFLRLTEENLNYPSASRIRAVFPQRISQDEADKFVRNPEALANRVYANRLGNHEPDDGWRYRTRGFIGTIGRSGYERSARLIGVDLIADPDALREDRNAAREAVAVFKQIRTQPDDVVGLVRAINGGLNGLAETQAIREKLLPGVTRITDDLRETFDHPAQDSER